MLGLPCMHQDIHRLNKAASRLKPELKKMKQKKAVCTYHRAYNAGLKIAQRKKGGKNI